MSLPKIENYPTKKVKLPISKKEVKIRPFLVREEKILIMSREDDNATQKDHLEAICQVIEACTLSELNALELNEVDLTYLFMRIRMMSKGEGSKSTYKCKANVEGNECGNLMEIQIDLSKIEAYRPEGYSDLFTIPGTEVHIKMRMPTMQNIMTLEEKGINVANMKSMKWQHLEMLLSICVESVIEGTADNSTVNDSFTTEEIAAWFEGVPDTVLEDIIDNFLQKLPYLRYSVNETCSKCGTEHNFDITGLENFFG